MELLRIIAMFFIVVSHYAVHSGIKYDNLHMMEKTALSMFNIGNLGVDIFVIISGYFMINSKFKLKKLMMLEAQVLFYTIICYIIVVVNGAADISIKSIAFSFLPTLFEHYWFFTAYIVMYIFTPYINRLIHSLSREAFLKFLLIMILLWSFTTTFATTGLYSYPLGTFLLLYSIGAYIRLYPDFKYNTNKSSIITIILCEGFLLMSVIVFGVLGIDKEAYFFQRLSLPTLLLAVGIFVLFTHINIRYNSFINLVASSTFGIYLIHENTYVRAALWPFLQHLRGGMSHIIYALICAVAVFIVCSIIELIRSRTEGVLADKLISKLLYVGERPIGYLKELLLNKILQ